MPVRPPAPERDSMTMACPSTVAIFSVKMRLIVSAGPPAGNGTMNFTERFGNSWVIAAAGNARTQITHMRRINVNIAADSPRLFLPATTSTTCDRCVPSATGRHSDQCRAAREPPQLVDEPHTRIASERLFCKARRPPTLRSPHRPRRQPLGDKLQPFSHNQDHTGNRPV